MSFLTPHLSNLTVRHGNINKGGRAKFTECKRPKPTEIANRKIWCERQLSDLRLNPSNAVLEVRND